MARLLAEIALFLVPFAAFAVYLRYGRKVDSVFAGWSLRAMIGCSVVAVLLVALSLYFLEASSRGPTTGRYVPPTWEDGVLVPGHIE
ncbi:hypothetical protein KHC23_08810 [Ancylobacter dichloromethanicus]|uniref:Uncharacterized protein n=1 Tax=Ancylobacter dichloromethanicus TaxID=518825 RepID=A0A9W6MYA9_9HYPH|nr:DUF6111 family protein [Ancylobacter dichloromethanicus]MBS7553750.1 hypothetical protein [Ancylobacter dichloromethanicus]GLK70856.1 hypothetical protein GCM10017643_09710 [Ancylobacter dichloromethanicus]